MNRIDQLRNSIEQLNNEIAQIQGLCSHPGICTLVDRHRDSGDPLGTPETIVDYHCTLCDKKWTEIKV